MSATSPTTSTTPTPNYLTGSVVAITVGTLTMYATKSDYTRQVNTVKVTNARSGGYQELKPGIKSSRGSVEVVVNADTLYEFTPGQEVIIHWVPTGGNARTLNALVTTVKESFVVDGELINSFDWESSGQWYAS